MRRTSCWIILLLGFATFLAIASLALLATSFGTNNWIEIEVDRDALNSDNQYKDTSIWFDRDRGLFRTCYEPKEDVFWLDSVDDKVDTNCQLEQGYELDDFEPPDDHGDDYKTRVHLLRTHFMLFSIGIILALVVCIMGIVSFWKAHVRLYLAAGIIAFITALFIAGGMAVFHVYKNIEDDDLNFTPFKAFWNSYDDADLSRIARNTEEEFGYSYYLGWVSMVLSMLACILFLIASAALSSAKRKEKQPEDTQPFARSQKGYHPQEPAILPMRPPLGPPPMVAPSTKYGYGTTGSMVPVVQVGPPMVPVVPVSEMSAYAASTRGYDYDYADFGRY